MKFARPFIAAAAAAIALIAPALAPPSHAAAFTDPPGEIMLPPAYSTDVTRLDYIVGDASGFAWQSNNYVDGDQALAVHYSAYGGSQNVDAGSTGQGLFSLAGSQLRLHGATGGLTTPAKPAVDISSDATIPNPTDNGGTWSTGDGAFSQLDNNYSGTYSFVRTNNSGSVLRTYQPPMFEGTDSMFDVVDVQAVDENGAVFSVHADRGPDNSTTYATLDYLDFTTGDYTVLDDDTDAEDATAAMSSDDIVWTLSNDGKHAFYVPRGDVGATPTLAAPDGHIGWLALNGDELGYTTATRVTTDNPADETFQKTMKTGLLGSSTFTTVGGSLPIVGPIMPANNGDFAVVAGSTIPDYGVYRLHVGGTELSGNLVLFGPTAPLGIDASAGRILSVIDGLKTRPVEQTRVAAGADTVTASSKVDELVANTPVGIAPASAGSTTVSVKRTPSGAVAVVLDGTDEVGTYELPASVYHVTMAGDLLLVPYFADYNTASNGAVLIDMADGSSTDVPESEALVGTTEDYIGSDGIHELDVLTRNDTTIPDSATCSGSRRYTVLEADGDWVLCDSRSGNGSVAYNVATGARIEVPTTAKVYDDQAVDDVLLANGLVTWIDAHDRSVHLFDLATQTDQVVGTAHAEVSDHQYLALNEDALAWVAPDDTTRVIPLGAASTAAPRYLGDASAPTFSTALSGRSAEFRPRLNTNRPLTRWTMIIRTMSGKHVTTLHGAAPTGGVRPVWNGKVHGRKVRSGTYTWTLTGKGRTGSLRRTNGSTKPISGTIRIDTIAPKVSIHASAGTTRKRVTSIPVHWKCAGGPCLFTVSYEVSKNGHWSRPKRWLVHSSLRSARLGSATSGVIVAATVKYRFLVRAFDEAGNPSRRVTSATVRS